LKNRDLTPSITFLFVILILAYLLVPLTYGSSGSENVTLGGSETINIGKWEPPWPLNDYLLELYAIPSFEGSNTLSWSTDKDLISSGESLSLTVDLEKNKHDYKMDFRAIWIKESTGENIHDKTVGIDLSSIEVPGSWSSPSIAVPIMHFELKDDRSIVRSCELNLQFRFNISTKYLISIETYELEPQSKTLDITSGSPVNFALDKKSGAGAEVELVNSSVEAQGEMAVTGEFTMTGYPSYMVDFATVPIVEWTTIKNQNVDMALLKTPAEIDFSLNSEIVNLGESVTVCGNIQPSSQNIPVEILIDGAVVATVQTRGDGSFLYLWESLNAGAFSVQTKSQATKYATAATSSSAQLLVNEPPESSFTFSPNEPQAEKTVQFRDESTDLDGRVVSWRWEFGDGTTSEEKNPKCEYINKGIYTVKLTVKDDHGAEEISTDSITVEPAPTAIPSPPPIPTPIPSPSSIFPDTSMSLDWIIIIGLILIIAIFSVAYIRSR